MTTYVLGFLFSADKKRVALIRKNKPDWQKGKLNGVGGKVEDFDENHLAAMSREFYEETGALVKDWQPFAELSGNEAGIACYYASADVAITSTTDEQVGWYPIDKLSKLPVIPNLRWLIPLALDESTIHTEAQFC